MEKEKLRSDYSPAAAGSRIDEKHSENAKERKSLKKASETRRIAPSGPTQILPAVQVARRRPRDLAGLWGQRPPPRAKRPATMQHAGPPAATKKAAPRPARHVLREKPSWEDRHISRSPWRASIQPIGTDLSDRAAGQKKDPGRSEEQKENGGAATGKLREIGKRKAAE